MMPWRDGTTHLVLSPPEFMQRLAALVPRARLHLIRFGVRITSLREVSGTPLREHGVLAPNAKLGAQVVPQEPGPPTQATPPVECEASCAHHRPVRLSWAKRLKRVFDLDMEHRPNCGGELKIVAAILEVPMIEKILTHLGLQTRAPPLAPPRGSQLQAARRPDHPDLSLFMRPAAQGREDQLCPGFPDRVHTAQESGFTRRRSP